MSTNTANTLAAISNSIVFKFLNMLLSNKDDTTTRQGPPIIYRPDFDSDGFAEYPSCGNPCFYVFMGSITVIAILLIVAGAYEYSQSKQTFLSAKPKLKGDIENPAEQESLVTQDSVPVALPRGKSPS